MVQLEDIESVLPEIAHLPTDERNTLLIFTLLWTIFEFRILDTNASVSILTRIVENSGPNITNDNWYSEHLNYFIDRYVNGGQVNNRFENLRLRPTDNPDLVRSVLTGKALNPKDQLLCCLIIVYRYRNNFFHGIKWLDGFLDQGENFRHSALLLKKFMDRAIRTR